MIALAADLGRHADDPRQRARRPHQGQMAFVTEGVAALQHHRDVQRLVEDARKGMRRVQPQRRQHRQHLMLEIALQPALLARRPLPAGEDVDLFVFQLRADLLLPGGIDLGHQVQHAGADARQQFAGGHAVRPRRGRTVGVMMLEHGHAHLEELVEVVRHDAHVAHAFEQGHAGIAGHRQYAEVELECGQLAAEVQLRGGKVDGGNAGGRSGHGPFWPMAMGDA